MLRSVRRLVSRTPPRAHVQLLIAICDEHELGGDLVQRFHDTSPNGPRLYHMICGVVTLKSVAGSMCGLRASAC